MGKKNLIILLMIPFIIALLSIVTANITINVIDKDILGIKWNYNEIETYKHVPGKYYELNATPITENNISYGAVNLLEWEVKNKDGSILEPLAEIIYQNGRYFLTTKGLGEVIVTCRNVNGNVSKSFTALIYDAGAVLAYPKVSASGTNIDSTIYYGTYDLSGGNKVGAKIALNVVATQDKLYNALRYYDVSSNITIDEKNHVVNIIGTGDAYFSITSDADEGITPFTYRFRIVENGVNVYTYDDLLYCTNQSENGEIVVLRKSFESTAHALDANGNLVANNIEVFGHYTKRGDKYSYSFSLGKKELYDFETTFNQNFITEWNNFAKTNKDYQEITNRVNVGLRVQKDFYGNGYTINMHNLAYPYEEQQLNIDGVTSIIPVLTSENKFRGPLPFYTLGDPNKLPLVTAYGQDNIGMYVDGDNITINDLELKNCDFGNSLANLEYTGTVMELNGDNITIQNSRLSNGKNVLRSFSNDNVRIYNSMLSYAMNFLITTGSNKFIPVDGEVVKSFIENSGTVKDEKINVFLKAQAEGDNILNYFISASFTDKKAMKDSVMSLQNALNDISLLYDENGSVIYDGTMTIEDTLFYRSGIASISLDSYFNGPFLYSAIPSAVTALLDMFTDQTTGIKLIPIIPTEISGLSYPVKVSLEGSTEFYDQKSLHDIDLNGLINENMSEIASGTGMLDEDKLITIDHVFPVKSLLSSIGSSCISNIKGEDGANKQYISIPIVKYGGGGNLSVYDASKLDNDYIKDDLSLSFLDSYLNLPVGDNFLVQMQNMILKTVTTVTGYEPFVFTCTERGHLYGQAPSISKLKENFKEDSK